MKTKGSFCCETYVCARIIGWIQIIFDILWILILALFLAVGSPFDIVSEEIKVYASDYWTEEYIVIALLLFPVFLLDLTMAVILVEGSVKSSRCLISTWIVYKSILVLIVGSLGVLSIVFEHYRQENHILCTAIAFGHVVVAAVFLITVCAGRRRELIATQTYGWEAEEFRVVSVSAKVK